MRVVHIGLFAEASEHVDVRQAARALAPTAVLAPTLLLGAAALDGAAQLAVWGLVLALDFVGGGLRGIGGWRLSPGHFAERHGLVVIIALGSRSWPSGWQPPTSSSVPAPCSPRSWA